MVRGHPPTGHLPETSVLSETHVHPSEDQLLDLTRGYLSDTEQEEILHHVSGCASCEASFAEMLARQERVRSRGTLVDSGNGLHLEPHTPGPNHHGVRRRRTVWILSLTAVAASLGLLLFASRDHVTELAVPALPEVGARVHLRAETARPGDPLEGGLQAYARGDLPRAIELLSEPAEGAADHVRRVFLGSAQARSGDYASAVATLQELPFDSIPDPWGSEARWALAVSLLRTGRTEMADVILRELATEPGVVGDRARQMVPDR